MHDNSMHTTDSGTKRTHQGAFGEQAAHQAVPTPGSRGGTPSSADENSNVSPIVYARVPEL